MVTGASPRLTRGYISSLPPEEGGGWFTRLDHYISEKHRIFGHFAGAQNESFPLGLIDQAFPGTAVSSTGSLGFSRLPQVPVRPAQTAVPSASKVTPRNDHISLSVVERRSAAQTLKLVKQHGLEGVIAKRSDSVYEPGKRSGLWTKTRITLGQEFVVGGYTPGTQGFDALIVGYYRGKDLMFAARVRAGFVPATRREVFARIKDLKIPKCPFANLPEVSEGRWGQGLTAEKMKGCVWVKPKVVVRIDFAEWTGAGKLRHTKFVAIRDDKDPAEGCNRNVAY